MQTLWKSSNKFPWTCKQGRTTSKLELSLKNLLKEHGFIHSSEREPAQIAKLTYVPDYVHEQNKSILEIYGDYWHCNPKHPIFGNPLWYHPDLKMTAKERWDIDAKRTQIIEDQGYNVLIVWEMDLTEEYVQLIIKNNNV